MQLVSTQFNSKLKIIRSDNGQEFTMPSFYAEHGIIHQTSCVETPQQNSKVERKPRHVLDITRAFLFHSKLPKIFWSYVVCHAVFIINRLPIPVLEHKSPFEMFSTPPTFWMFD